MKLKHFHRKTLLAVGAKVPSKAGVFIALKVSANQKQYKCLLVWLRIGCIGKLERYEIILEIRNFRRL